MSDILGKQTQAEFRKDYMEFMKTWKDKISMQEYAIMSTTLSLCVLLQAVANSNDFYNMLEACVAAAEEGVILAKEEQNK